MDGWRQTSKVSVISFNVSVFYFCFTFVRKIGLEAKLKQAVEK